MRRRRIPDDAVTFRVAAAVAGVVVLIVVAWVLLNADQRLDDGKADRARLHSAVDRADAKAAEADAKAALLADQLRDLGEKPIVEPGSTPVPKGAPTPAIMLNYASQALQAFCADGRCTPEKPKDGENGADGRGIASSECTADGLIVRYTDGTSQNAGQCRGPAGEPADPPRSVTSTQCTDDGWVVTYSDGTSENAGRCRTTLIDPS